MANPLLNYNSLTLKGVYCAAYVEDNYAFAEEAGPIPFQYVLEWILTNINSVSGFGNLGEYANDAAAEAGGVEIDKPYQLAKVNDYGMAWGVVKIRKE